MNSGLFKHVCETLEAHFQRPFGTADTRNKALNNVFAAVRMHEDKDLELACDRLIMNNRMLPTPIEFQSAIISQAQDRQRKLTADIEADAEKHRREAQQHSNIMDRLPDTGSVRDGMKALHLWQSGRITRRELLQLYAKLAKEYPNQGWEQVVATTGHRLKNLDEYHPPTMGCCDHA